MTPERLADLETLVEAGKIRAMIDKTYPLSDAAQGMRHLEDRSVQGKIVISV